MFHACRNLRLVKKLYRCQTCSAPCVHTTKMVSSENHTTRELVTSDWKVGGVVGVK